MSYITIQREVERGTAVVTFNRPEKLNALCSRLLSEFHDALKEIELDEAIRVIIITGEGRGFVAGADIEEYSNQKDQKFIDYQLYSRRLFTYLHYYPKPVIAAVNGYALGGGFEIVLCCDIIIASEKAKLGLPEALLGLVPGGGGVQKLSRLVGRHIASDLLFTGRQMDAGEALRLGIASEVVSPELLMEAALKKADKINSSGPLAVRELKRVLHEGSDLGFEEALTLEQEALFRIIRSQDGREGIQAFTGKRKPNFIGR